MRKNFGSNPWFYPLPVLIIGTYDKNGNPDAMNAAWGGLYDRDKVVLCLSAGHKTTANIKASGAFTASFADAPHVLEADYVGLVSANQIPDKLKRAGLHPLPSQFVNAPLIEEFPLALECKLLKITEDGNLIGQIINVSADEKILGQDGKIDVAKLQAISFEPCGNYYVKMGEIVGNAFQDGKKLQSNASEEI